mgnify:CR=1 FL=1
MDLVPVIRKLLVSAQSEEKVAGVMLFNAFVEDLEDEDGSETRTRWSRASSFSREENGDEKRPSVRFCYKENNVWTMTMKTNKALTMLSTKRATFVLALFVLSQSIATI